MKLSVPEVAALLGASEGEVYGWIQREGLPHVAVQDRVYVHRAELYDWAHATHRRIEPEVFAEAGADLAEALRRGGVHTLALPDEPLDAAARLARLLELPDAAVGILAARPELGFAVDPDGVAVPRVREPILAPGPPAVHLLALDPARDTGGVALTRAFVVVAPTVRVHQRLLAELDAALFQPAFRAGVLTTPPVLEGLP